MFGPEYATGVLILQESNFLIGWKYDHDDVIKWKHFPRYWPFVRGMHRSPVNSPAQRPLTRIFDVFFDLRPNKRLSKQSWGWWFETTSRSLWQHCNVFSFLSTLESSDTHICQGPVSLCHYWFRPCLFCANPFQDRCRFIVCWIHRGLFY